MCSTVLFSLTESRTRFHAALLTQDLVLWIGEQNSRVLPVDVHSSLLFDCRMLCSRCAMLVSSQLWLVRRSSRVATRSMGSAAPCRRDSVRPGDGAADTQVASKARALSAITSHA